MTDIVEQLRETYRQDQSRRVSVEGVAADEIEALREWIESEAERTDICTYNILGKICGGCRCERTSS